MLNSAEKRLLGGLLKAKKAKGRRKIYFLGIPVWKTLHDDKGTRHYLFGFLCVFRKIKKLPDPHFTAENFSPLAMDNRILLAQLKKLGEFTYVPNPGNMGDMLIASATLQFFDRKRLPYRMLDGERADVIVYGGGGIWTKDYEEWQPWILSLFADAKRILILPSSFNNCGMLVKALDSRFTVFCREKKSFDYLTAQKTGATVLLDHDMGFRLTPDILHGGILLKRKHEMDAARETAKRVSRMFHDMPKVFMAMRVDCESTGGHETDGDLSDCAHGEATASRMYIDFITKTMLAAVDSVDVVITDRLHVGIAGALMGKEVYLLDNSYGKLSSVYKHTLMGNPQVHFTDRIPCGIVPRRTATDNLRRLETFMERELFMGEENG